MDFMNKKFKKINQIFSLKEAILNGVSHHTIKTLMSSGEIERVERGIYRFTNSDFSDEQLFQLATKKIDSKSAVALLSALSYYDLTDIIPKAVWLLVPYQKRTISKNIKLYRAQDPKWDIGIISENGFSITSIERSIVDSITHAKVIPVKVGLDALKVALSQKKTKLSKIIDMSVALGVQEKVIPQIEILV
jgi:predicted transcriptional regulator of viral defense system